MDPSVPQRGGGGGEGIAQWTHAFRKARFGEVVGVPVRSASLGQQLGYLVREMTDSTLYVTNQAAVAKGRKPIYDKLQYNAGQLVLKSTSASSAATIFVRDFERPRDAEGQIPVRSRMADEISKFQDFRRQNDQNKSYKQFRDSVRGKII